MSSVSIDLNDYVKYKYLGVVWGDNRFVLYYKIIGIVSSYVKYQVKHLIIKASLICEIDEEYDADDDTKYTNFYVTVDEKDPKKIKIHRNAEIFYVTNFNDAEADPAWALQISIYFLTAEDYARLEANHNITKVYVKPDKYYCISSGTGVDECRSSFDVDFDKYESAIKLWLINNRIRNAEVVVESPGRIYRLRIMTDPDPTHTYTYYPTPVTDKNISISVMDELDELDRIVNIKNKIAARTLSSRGGRSRSRSRIRSRGAIRKRKRTNCTNRIRRTRIRR